MNPVAWKSFVKAKERFRKEVARLERSLPELGAYQQKLVDDRTPSYTVETPVVYNNALDDVGRDGEIKLILVADNPGRREQAGENRRYLVGPSGKIAEKFFRDNPSLGIDFRKNVIILNKPPVHTPRTADLRQLCRSGGAVFEKTLTEALAESQRFMARLLLEFHEALAYGGKIPPVWITGYSEMGKNGVFAAYTAELKTVYGKNGLGKTVFLYRHFSMNQFTIDLKQQTLPGEPLARTLRRVGTAYKQRFLW
jgi:hypothetical protein